MESEFNCRHFQIFTHSFTGCSIPISLFGSEFEYSYLIISLTAFTMSSEVILNFFMSSSGFPDSPKIS